MSGMHLSPEDRDELEMVTASNLDPEVVVGAVESIVARRVAEVAAQRDLLAKAMWEARTWMGYDPDGDHGFHSTNWQFIADQHVREAKEFRDDYQEALDELYGP